MDSWFHGFMALLALALLGFALLGSAWLCLSLLGHNINNITSGVQYQATTASVNNLKVFPTLRGLRSLPLHLRVSIHMHASNTYTVIVCFLELLLMRVHTLRSNPKIQKPLTPKHC